MEFGFYTAVVVCSTIVILVVLFITNHRKFANFKLDAKILGAPVKIDNTASGAPTQESLPPPASSEEAKATTIPDALEDGSFPKVWDDLEAAFEEQAAWKLKSVFERVKLQIAETDKEYLFPRYYYLLARLGDDEGTKGLDRLIQESPGWSHAFLWRTSLHELFEGKPAAVAAVNEKFDSTNAPPEWLIRLYFTKNAPFDTLEQFCRRVERVKLGHLSATEKAGCYWAAAESVLEKSNVDLYIFFAEQSLSLNPANHDRRFKFAYELGERNGPKWMVRHHYSTLIAANPHYGSAKNNLAALYNSDDEERLKYAVLMKDAVASSHNQATGNLAIYAANSGLFDTARELIRTSRANEHNYNRIKEAERIVEEREKAANEEVDKDKTAARRKYAAVRDTLRWSNSKHTFSSQDFLGTFFSKDGTEVEITRSDGSMKLFIKRSTAKRDGLSVYEGYEGSVALEGVVLFGHISRTTGRSLLDFDFQAVALGFLDMGQLSLIFGVESEAPQSFVLTRTPVVVASAAGASGS